MEKLKLEQLTCYLPYGLKVKIIPISNLYEEKITIVDCISSEFITFKQAPDYYFEDKEPDIDFKPILRPMSDLLKWIEDDRGRKIFPAQILWSIDSHEEERWNVYGVIPDYWMTCSKVKPEDHDYITFKHFLKWHFDVFSLIPNGLAIDINTIK